MLFVFHAIDRPGHRDLRRANTDAHVAYLKSADRIKLLLAGPLLADDEQTVIGSLLVVDAPDAATAREFFAGDPYNKAGLFAEARLSPLRKTVGWNEL